MDEDGQTEKFIGNELGQARRISMAKQSEVVVVLLDHQHLCVCRQPEVHPDTTTGMRAPYKVCGPEEVISRNVFLFCPLFYRGVRILHFNIRNNNLLATAGINYIL